jgi:hypothetical protein
MTSRTRLSNRNRVPEYARELVITESLYRTDRSPLQMSWQTAPLSLLNTYRVSHNLPTPAAFTSPYRQALLSNPGIGRQSPTMARRKEKRRISKEQLALAVRKHFNSAAVSEIDVVCESLYKVKEKGGSLATSVEGFSRDRMLTRERPR